MNQKSSALALGTDNVWKLLLQYAVPSIIAMTASSLYNIIDSIFIGHGVGALAIAGLAITFPLMNLSAAFGSMVGVGASALMSLRLGQKDYSTATHILGNVLTLNTIFGIGYSVLVLLFLDPVLRFFGASNATLPYAHDYMFIILLGNVVTHMYLGLNSLLRASGSPQKSMSLMIGSVIINSILAPVFIFGFKWGIRGAAMATVFAQIAMLAWQIQIFAKKSNLIHFQKGTFQLKPKIVSDTMAIGISPFLMNSVSCVIVIFINQELIRYGSDLHVGAYGIINRVAFLFAMVVMGLNQGMQPIAGYNFGANQIDRVNKVLKYTLMLATVVMTLGFLLSELIPHEVASLFTEDKTLTQYAVAGLRIVFMFCPLVSIQMVTANFFQSIGMAKKSIFMSLSRQLIFLLPGLILLPHFYGVKGVWYSLPVADAFSCIVASYMLVVVYRKSVVKH
ncbi:MAG: MATE family efflux transporter [Bacteroidota bacterium]|nr:MATE family efflux transporter [Bacteroidota bacterium]MDP4272956.1 MATE family efflux transporter [Bacteroidota bacterium]